MAKKKNKLDFAKIMKSGKSIGLAEGLHENVVLSSVERGEKINNLGAENRQHLFINFNKEDKNGNVLGNFLLNFFKIDVERDSALYGFTSLLKRIKEVALVYYTEEEFYAKFDPMAVLIEDDEEAEDIKDEFSHDIILSTRFEIRSNIAKVEEAAVDMAADLLSKKAGEDSERVRIKLEKNVKSDYVEAPRYSRFIEPMSVAKKDSVLYNAK